MKKNEIYISVDVETSGPVPGEFSLLSVGACLVQNPTKSVYIELQPDRLRHDAEALAVTGLSLEHLQQHGLPPIKAMERLSEWISTVKQPEMKVIFVGLNAPFDWSFINYYFHKYLGDNPFGFTAIDIKAYYMGLMGCSWSETKSSRMAERLHPVSKPSHNALDDARFQAELFALMIEEQKEN
ncbi:3'-5' exonuclease [Xenorhabdus bovienii]|uniref:Exonuclease RNase T and DNA polymerase III n=1 Tax=Xenorhabdus bovienii str. kraussei Becker Underwood TaxID=1398204 RepID=A0A077PPK6_XENBV|nr:3'-5' exonuclease [Xenorhabdus bovienii]CDH26265.1 Exonuclease RNase T and DNA polymerase III [Xenorhabdus bovienii str. kraussei Becker Underwood]